MTEQSLWLVADSDGCLRNIFMDYASAEKYIVNHGDSTWTIDEDVMC